MKNPDECANIHEVREEIDIIDREVIDALSKRFHEASVRAPDRFQAMLQQRREWALESGLNPDVVENIYRDLVNYYIEEELKHYKSE
ncbi:MAG: isochorismate-pyruvate lyase [Oscillatoriales cyanobacterium]|nr:MAG: isochorismate-pyruvate lyase [Oscillatoriales cyanobacterium]